MSDIHTDIYDEAAVETVRRQLQIDPHRIKRLRHLLLQQGCDDDRAAAELPEPAREPFLRQAPLHPLRLMDRRPSAVDRSVKLLFQTRQGALLESVVLATPTGRTTLCISSQVGCRAGCVFCATARMEQVVNLTCGEIVDQLTQANQHLQRQGRRVRNVVLMGMGEPLHNFEAVSRALEVLQSPRGFAHSPARTIVSTVGVPAAMVQLARRHPRVRIALSLHSATADVRRRLIPLARQHSLPELREALEEVVRVQGQEAMIQYLMLAGINDSDRDAAQLAAFLDGLPCHINLIPYNSIDNAPSLQATARPRRDQFAQLLRERGFLTTIRCSQGADIAAACGQLAAARASNVECTSNIEGPQGV